MKDKNNTPNPILMTSLNFERSTTGKFITCKFCGLKHYLLDHRYAGIQSINEWMINHYTKEHKDK